MNLSRVRTMNKNLVIIAIVLSISIRCLKLYQAGMKFSRISTKNMIKCMNQLHFHTRCRPFLINKLFVQYKRHGRFLKENILKGNSKQISNTAQNLTWIQSTMHKNVDWQLHRSKKNGISILCFEVTWTGVCIEAKYENSTHCITVI